MRLALDAGISRPTDRQCLEYGLHAAAQLSPLALPDAEVPHLIRQALFHLDPAATGADPEIKKMFFERFCAAFEDHLKDSTEQFNNWFWGPKNSFLKQLAKQRRARGEERTDEEIRGALLELGWAAYEYVAGCLSCQMQAFANALPQPLAPAERQIFEQMHLLQPHFGGLSLILLAERLGFCARAIQDVVEHPGDPSRIQVFHRSLSNYAILAWERREADRRVKAESQKEGRKMYALKEGDSSDGKEALGEDPPMRVQHPADLGPELAGRLAQRHNIRCNCTSDKKATWVGRIDSSRDDEELRAIGVYTIILCCGKCRFTREIDSNELELSTLRGPDEA
jgi:hypothetical protein